MVVRQEPQPGLSDFSVHQSEGFDVQARNLPAVERPSRRFTCLSVSWGEKSKIGIVSLKEANRGRGESVGRPRGWKSAAVPAEDPARKTQALASSRSLPWAKGRGILRLPFKAISSHCQSGLHVFWLLLLLLKFPACPVHPRKLDSSGPPRSPAPFPNSDAWKFCPPPSPAPLSMGPFAPFFRHQLKSQLLPLDKT